MAKTPEQPEDDTPPQVLREPDGEEAKAPDPCEDKNVWIRGLWMVLFACLFSVGQALLLLATVLQFLWLLFAKEKNPQITAFGGELADWLARVARFQTVASEEKPFPCAPWGEAKD